MSSAATIEKTVNASKFDEKAIAAIEKMLGNPLPVLEGHEAKNKNDHKEPGYEHGLLLGISIVGDKKADTQNNKNVNDGIAIH